jgi:hypothetical protein
MKKEKTIDARIIGITKEMLVEDGSPFLDVSFEIVENGEVLSTRKLGFPLDTPEKEIAEEVKKTAQGYKADLALAESRKLQEALDLKVDAAIESLTSKEL